MLFNVYYLNFPKVYEIKMMLSNLIKTEQTVETATADSNTSELQAKMGVKFLQLFNIEAGAGFKAAASDSQKVLETFKVTTTKSLILNEVIDKCINVATLEESINEGSLIKVDSITLSLENETELRTVKMFSNGTFKGMRPADTGGIDINNLFNSLFKDYSYKLKGVLNNSDESILIKIPLTFENEFESSYNVDDLFIGLVSIIGIYKGKTKIEKLKNSFEFFQELGLNSPNNNEEDEVHNSQYPVEIKTSYKSSGDDKEYHYIDLLAIVQLISSKREKESVE